MDTIEKRNFRIGKRQYSILSDPKYGEALGARFEPNTTELINNLITNGTAIDVGANIGCTTLLMAEVCQQVHSFEPVPSTCSLLSENIRRNCISNVEIYNLGLGVAEAASQISFSPGNRSGGFVSDLTQASVGHEVEAVKIVPGDTLGLRPSFIKVDVEGYEALVLRGLRDTLECSRPVVMFEANHWCLNVFRRTALPDFIEEVCEIFPVLYAADSQTYLDLKNDSDRYIFYYQHVVNGTFQNCVGGYDLSQLSKFFDRYKPFS